MLGFNLDLETFCQLKSVWLYNFCKFALFEVKRISGAYERQRERGEGLFRGSYCLGNVFNLVYTLRDASHYLRQQITIRAGVRECVGCLSVIKIIIGNNVRVIRININLNDPAVKETKQLKISINQVKRFAATAGASPYIN